MTRPTVRRIAADDAGFSLLELLVTIFLIGIVAVPLGGALMGYLQNALSTTTTLNDSHDPQIVSAYWAQDVSSIGTRATTPPYALAQSVDDSGSAGWSYPCAVVGATPLVRFAWDDHAKGLIRVSYVRLTANGQSQLVRLQCIGSSAPTSRVLMAHDLNPSIPPTVTCLTATGGSSCTGSEGQVPVQITLTLHIKDGKDADADPYTVALVGVRRQT